MLSKESRRLLAIQLHPFGDGMGGSKLLVARCKGYLAFGYCHRGPGLVDQVVGFGNPGRKLALGLLLVLGPQRYPPLSTRLAGAGRE